MKIDIITIFPEFFEGMFKCGIIGKAVERGVVDIRVVNLRDYADPPHRTTDDYPYGGGAGMVMKVEPIVSAIEDLKGKNTWVILLSPQGSVFTQAKALELSKKSHIMLVCGRYKAVDDRVRHFIDEEISIGDYVLSGGEVPALVLIDAVVRLVPGVVGDVDSVESDSFFQGRLDCPWYTRPEVFRGMRVPKVLLSGNHAKIGEWRLRESLRRTLARRRDLLDRPLTAEEERLLKEIREEENGQGD